MDSPRDNRIDPVGECIALDETGNVSIESFDI